MDNYYPRIKDLREDSDYSQYYVSEYLQMKQPQYSRYERGLRDIPSDVLIRLAKLYNTSTDFRSYRQPEKTLLNLLNKPLLFA